MVSRKPVKCLRIRWGGEREGELYSLQPDLRGEEGARPGKDKSGSLERWEGQLHTIPYQVGGSVTWHLWDGTPW